MRFLRRCGLFAGLGAATALAALLAMTGTAEAAFPGRNGLLALQSLSDSGVVLVNPNGTGERLVCATPSSGAPVCSLGRPRWSPDGRVVVAADLATSWSWGSSVVIYPDGSCLNCTTPAPAAAGPQLPSSLLQGVDATFMRDPTLATTVTRLGGVLVEYGVDGVGKETLLSGPVSQPAWSSHGQLAVVRGGWIWAGRPGRLRRLTRGSSPAWSPDGTQMVFVRGGWLMIGKVSGHSFRRLVGGTAPAWSPNGKWIAFIGKRRRLSVVRASGGHVRRIGAVTGRTVDWQPLPATQSTGCQTPLGSTVLATSDTATLSADSAGNTGQIYDGSQAAIGCLRTDGRERVLGFTPPYLEGIFVRKGAVAAPYAAVLFDGGGRPTYCPAYIAVKAYDLRSASELPTREIRTDCAAQATGDQPVVGSDAVMAVHVTLVHPGSFFSSGGTVEQIQASDSTGAHTLDSVTEPDGSPPALTDLTLTGDTLTWEHNGSPRSAQLQP